jgi:hypothetical protein
MKEFKLAVAQGVWVLVRFLCVGTPTKLTGSPILIRWKTVPSLTSSFGKELHIMRTPCSSAREYYS